MGSNLGPVFLFTFWQIGLEESPGPFLKTEANRDKKCARLAVSSSFLQHGKLPHKSTSIVFLSRGLQPPLQFQQLSVPISRTNCNNHLSLVFFGPRHAPVSFTEYTNLCLISPSAPSLQLSGAPSLKNPGVSLIIRTYNTIFSVPIDPISKQNLHMT